MTNRGPQKTVRVGQFEKALEQFKKELDFDMAQKTASVLARFHGLYVAPLERRVLIIETILLIRPVRWCWRKFVRAWDRFYRKMTIPDDGFCHAKTTTPEGEKVECNMPLGHEGNHIQLTEEDLAAIKAGDERDAAAKAAAEVPEPEPDGVERIIRLSE